MDDGIELGATITYPSADGSAPAPGRFPVVLNMTPYGRDGDCSCESASDYATRGFVLAVVDVRGTGGSQGNLDENYFSPREARDGYDLVEFLGTQPWSNGKVGMSGGSYLGIMQYLTAEQDPPHLAAIAPDEALADVYNDAAYPGGILSLSFDAQYLAVQGAPGLLTPNSEPSMIPGTLTAKYEQATGRSVAFDYLENPFDDAFYQERSPITRVSKIHVPVFVLDGWRDAFEAGDIRMYRALERRKGVETLLNVGPCTHKGCGVPFDPTEEPPGVDNIEAQQLQFFQRQLMGMEVPSLPRVRLYVQQADAYMDTTAWPPKESAKRRYYVGPQGISSRRPAESSAGYITDPAAGLSMSFDQQGTVAASPYIPLDQRLEEEQGLTWRTPDPVGSAHARGPDRAASGRVLDRARHRLVRQDLRRRSRRQPEHRQRGAAARLAARACAQEHADGTVGVAGEPRSDHSGGLLRLRNRARADGLPARCRPPAAAAPHLLQHAQRAAGDDRLRRPGARRVELHAAAASHQHRALRRGGRHLPAPARVRRELALTGSPSWNATCQRASGSTSKTPNVFPSVSRK